MKSEENWNDFASKYKLILLKDGKVLMPGRIIVGYPKQYQFQNSQLITLSKINSNN